MERSRRQQIRRHEDRDYVENLYGPAKHLVEEWSERQERLRYECDRLEDMVTTLISRKERLQEELRKRQVIIPNAIIRYVPTNIPDEHESEGESENDSNGSSDSGSDSDRAGTFSTATIVLLQDENNQNSSSQVRMQHTFSRDMQTQLERAMRSHHGHNRQLIQPLMDETAQEYQHVMREKLTLLNQQEALQFTLQRLNFYVDQESATPTPATAAAGERRPVRANPRYDSYQSSSDDDDGEKESDDTKNTSRPIAKELHQALTHRSVYPLLMRGNMNHFHGSNHETQLDIRTLDKFYGQCECSIMTLKDDSESKPPFASEQMTLREFVEHGRDSYTFPKLHYLQQMELDRLDGKHSPIFSFCYCVPVRLTYSPYQQNSLLVKRSLSMLALVFAPICLQSCAIRSDRKPAITPRCTSIWQETSRHPCTMIGLARDLPLRK
jgi:hypothetical protein